MASTTTITNAAELATLLQDPKLVLVNFYRTPETEFPDLATIASASSQIANRIRYAKCDVTTNTWAEFQYEISRDAETSPTFIAFKDGNKISQMNGIRALVDGLPRIIMASIVPSSNNSPDSDWLAQSPPKTCSNITSAIESPRLELLNSSSSVKTLFLPAKPSGNAGDYVESDTDEQLMVFIPFQSAVKLHSFQITSLVSADEDEEDDEVPSRPKTLKIFANTPQILGFDEGEEREPTQTVELDWDKEGTAVVNTRFVKFQHCSGVTLFFVDVERDGAEKCRVDRIRVVGEKMGEKTDMAKLKQEQE